MAKRLFSYKVIICVIGWLCIINTSIAQTKSGLRLSDKLAQLEHIYEVSFSYNHTFFDNLFLEEDFECSSIAESITKIENLIPLKFSANTTNNYVIVPIRKTITFNIIDIETNENVNSITYNINRQKNENLYPEEDVFKIESVFPLDTIYFQLYFYKTEGIQAKDLLKTKILKLYKNSFHLNEIVLSSYLTKGVDAKISDHSLQINTQSLNLLAGETDGDVFAVLNNIPRIHSPSGKSGNLNFRGNTYDQNLIQIDDIPIYHSGHFLGAISPYNTSVITHIEVQRNMLPAKFGGRVGGLIDMTTSTKIPDSTKYDVAINTLFAGATIKTKLIEDKLAFTAAFRTSYPSFSSPKLEAISTLIFQGSRLEPIAENINSDSNFSFGFTDMNGKLNYKIDDNNSVSLSFINIQNNLSAKIQNINNDEVDFRDLELDNWGITGKWKARFSEKFTTELRISKSNMSLLSVSEGFIMDQRTRQETFDNTISDTRLITEALYEVNPSIILEAGYTLTDHQLTSNEIQEQNNIDSKRTQSASVHSTYLSLQKNWNDRLIFYLGIHNNYYSPFKKTYINPRLSASYAINNTLYFKSSFGTANQFIQKKFSNDFDDFNITNQLWYLPNKDIAVQKGIQSMLDGVFTISKWLIDLELFLKKTDNVTNKADDVLGSIYSIGTNIFIKKQWNRLETWISYALSKTETDFNNKKTDAFYNQRHVINLTGLLNLNKWKFAMSWGYFSGMPVIFSQQTDNTNFNSRPNERFDALHQLDFPVHTQLKALKTMRKLLSVYPYLIYTIKIILLMLFKIIR
ncbi:TonB-dependent receptor plug domain-containing protein [Winogradskyella sp. PG-2]|uniref:TonB-dependent receptor plug domain-containing protein n=1 Tax=Winogradskyella sp. PG-2 TaxID=754409 RepID=UPI00045861DB|nr:TonB-dependent receptor [Winogradskyella sp. PG-2]BAO77323.1 hypothetical protein WPG_3093 [Winogradskyella sp. PG-2]